MTHGTYLVSALLLFWPNSSSGEGYSEAWVLQETLNLSVVSLRCKTNLGEMLFISPPLTVNQK